ncbi:hypothetical protein HLRTI_002893 [Halorhabdus tiamatea SARL4B]|uniref:Uncharacterized protein n=2 Tax=Halorhabdus TaxID=146825 RepID=U2F9B5_9EURY|nr:hypothetical protein HLRTI_002893 [Halorhabdus tiamatea SARL4B]
MSNNSNNWPGEFRRDTVPIGEIEDGVRFEYRFTGSFAVVDETTETTEVERDSWGKMDRTIADVVDELGSTKGWCEWSDRGIVLAYGTDIRTCVWPNPDGKEFVGVADAHLSSQIQHGTYVGLYQIDAQLVPHVMTEDTAGDKRGPNDPTLESLPEGPLTEAFTFDIGKYQEMPAIVRDLEKRGVWAKNGYPHEITKTETVSARSIQVRPKYQTALRYPSYWVDDSGAKHRIS